VPRRSGLSLLAALVLLAALPAQGATRLEGLRTHEAPSYTRVVFDTSGEVGTDELGALGEGRPHRAVQVDPLHLGVGDQGLDRRPVGPEGQPGQQGVAPEVRERPLGDTLQRPLLPGPHGGGSAGLRHVREPRLAKLYHHGQPFGGKVALEA